MTTKLTPKQVAKQRIAKKEFEISLSVLGITPIFEQEIREASKEVRYENINKGLRTILNPDSPLYLSWF